LVWYYRGFVSLYCVNATKTTLLEHFGKFIVNITINVKAERAFSHECTNKGGLFYKVKPKDFSLQHTKGRLATKGTKRRLSDCEANAMHTN